METTTTQATRRPALALRLLDGLAAQGRSWPEAAAWAAGWAMEDEARLAGWAAELRLLEAEAKTDEANRGVEAWQPRLSAATGGTRRAVEARLAEARLAAEQADKLAREARAALEQEACAMAFAVAWSAALSALVFAVGARHSRRRAGWLVGVALRAGWLEAQPTD